MFRSASILILLAFVLGLWIGFNPEAHARAEKTWEETKIAFADLGPRITASVDHLFHQVSEESPPPANPPAKPENSTFLSRLQEGLQQIVDALKQLWNDLVASFRRAT